MIVEMPDAEEIISAEALRDSREIWLGARVAGIGGSDVAALMGDGHYDNQTPYDVWLSKTGRQPALEATEAMEWGQLSEAMIAARFVDLTGLMVERCGLMRSIEYPTLLASPDRVGDGFGLEIKNVNQYVKMPTDGSIRLDWRWQMAHYMFVTGLPNWYLAVLIGGQHMEIRELNENDDWVQAAFERIRVEVPDWWFRHVVCDEVPEVGKPPSFEDIDPSKKVETAVPGLLWEKRDRLVEVRSTAKAAKEEGSELNAELIVEAGSAEILTANGVPVIRVGYAQGRLGFEKDRFTREHPEININDYYKRGAGHRVVTVIGEKE